jgi:hypothetical protein
LSFLYNNALSIKPSEFIKELKMDYRINYSFHYVSDLSVNAENVIRIGGLTPRYSAAEYG